MELSNEKQFIKVLDITVDKSFTYGDTRPNEKDKSKREYIRKEANAKIKGDIKNMKWWAFRIHVKKSTKIPFDIDNALKIIVDAFSLSQIEKDDSKYTEVVLYKDDTIDFVRHVEITGERSEEDGMRIEIFGSINP